MGAHTAPRTVTVGRIAGRGALTAAAALALTGGTASLAFAGEGDHPVRSSHSCGCDEQKSWHDDDVKSDRDSDHDWKSDKDDDSDHDWKSDRDWKSDKDDEDCDDDGHHGRDGTWDDKDDDHGKWDDKDHGKHREDHRYGTVNGASYGGNHYGDDHYTITNTVNKGLLAGVL